MGVSKRDHLNSIEPASQEEKRVRSHCQAEPKALNWKLCGEVQDSKNPISNRKQTSTVPSKPETCSHSLAETDSQNEWAYVSVVIGSKMNIERVDFVENEMDRESLDGGSYD